MAATTETAEKKLLYKVLSPVKSGGKVYKVGDVVTLGADEAKKLADDEVIEAKAIKAKTEKSTEGNGEDPLALKVKTDTSESDDQTPPSGDETGTKE